ncbi:MAG: hypothetical protein GX556_13560 [Fibrobacter sp.]|nr:hypothetical protein [Fibrobacter sp.]
MKSVKSAVFCSLSLFVLASGLSAEEWKVDINANLTTALNSYSDSWVGGEAGSFTWASQLLGIAEKQINKPLNNKATLKLQFGQTKLQNKTSKTWSAPVKSSDLIDFEELLRFTLGGWVDPFISARVISQFVDGSDTLLTRYFNPVDITEAAGISRTILKSETIDWTTRLGAAARQVIDRKKLDPLTGDRFRDVTSDGGIEFNMDLKATNKENWLSYIGSLRIYEALISSKAEDLKGTDQENDWRYPHVKFENTLSVTVAKYLMLGFSVSTYYDRDIHVNFRLKETFSAGLTYIYTNSK